MRYASSTLSDGLVTFAVVSVFAWGWWPLMVSRRVEAWQGGVLVRSALYRHWIPWAHIQGIEATGPLVIDQSHHEDIPRSAIERPKVNPPRSNGRGAASSSDVAATDATPPTAVHRFIGHHPRA